MEIKIPKFELLNTLWYLNKKDFISLSLLKEILDSEGYDTNHLEMDDKGYIFHSKDLKIKYEKNRRL
jgi:hypothetical protein